MRESDDEKRQRAARIEAALDELREDGATLSPLTPPAGKQLASTFWGRAWCRHLAEFEVYEKRLLPGRTLLRKQQVLDLAIAPGGNTAWVVDDAVHRVRVGIQPMDSELWQEVVTACAGAVPSLLDLLSGQLGESVLATLTDPENGILPQPGDIRTVCGCDDYADPCRHAAAVLYGAGLKLDESPTLLFTLRGRDAAELLGSARDTAIADLNASSTELQGADLSQLFGIELDSDEAR